MEALRPGDAPLALCPTLSRKLAREKNRGAKAFCDNLPEEEGEIPITSN
jgi:hypothetical protein